MNEKSKRLREIGAVAAAQFETYLGSMHVNDLGEARVSATLLLTIGELYRAMETLLDHGSANHAGGPVRSMLEALANVLLIAKDPKHVYQMTFDNSREDANLLKRYIDAFNEAGGEGAPESLKQMAETANSRRASLAEEGFKKQAIAQKFEGTGRATDLYTAYGILCGLVHPNLTSLMARHVGQEKFVLHYRASPPPEVIDMLLFMAVPYLIEAMQILPSISDLDANDVQQFCDARAAELQDLVAQSDIAPDNCT